MISYRYKLSTGYTGTTNKSRYRFKEDLATGVSIVEWKLIK